MCNVAENEESRFWKRESEREREKKKRKKLISVDPQLEGHSTSKLVSFTSNRNVVGVDLALDIDILIGSNVKELDSNQRLRVVHLWKKTTQDQL